MANDRLVYIFSIGITNKKLKIIFVIQFGIKKQIFYFIFSVLSSGPSCTSGDRWATPRNLPHFRLFSFIKFKEKDTKIKGKVPKDPKGVSNFHNLKGHKTFQTQD